MSFFQQISPLKRLFFSILGLIVLQPVFQHPVALALLLAVVLLTALKVVGREHAHARLAMMVAGIFVVCLGLYILTDSVWSEAMSRGSGILFLGLSNLALYRHVLGTKEMNSDMLFACASIYLVLGLQWAMGFGLVELLQPGAFEAVVGAGVEASSWSTFVYFSFMTLTTVGYGDIVPVGDFARVLVILESVVGVLFVAVVVARVVGLHITTSSNSSS